MTFSYKGTTAPVAIFMKVQGGCVHLIHALSSVPGFNSLRIYKSIQMLTLPALARGPIGAGPILIKSYVLIADNGN